MAQAKRRCALRGRPARGGAEVNLRDARGARGRPLQPKGRGHGVEVQAELVCPRQGRPDGSPGSATLCLKTHESYHDRSHGVPRPDVVEARRGTRCHPKGRKRSVSVLTLIGGALPRETARKVVSLSRGGCRSAISASGPKRRFLPCSDTSGVGAEPDMPRQLDRRV